MKTKTLLGEVSASQAKRRARIEAGLCVVCGGAREPGRTTRRCGACMQAEVDRVRRKRRAGFCRVCAAPALEGRSMCAAHLEYYRDLRSG